MGLPKRGQIPCQGELLPESPLRGKNPHFLYRKNKHLVILQKLIL